MPNNITLGDDHVVLREGYGINQTYVRSIVTDVVIEIYGPEIARHCIPDVFCIRGLREYEYIVSLPEGHLTLSSSEFFEVNRAISYIQRRVLGFRNMYLQGGLCSPTPEREVYATMNISNEELEATLRRSTGTHITASEHDDTINPAKEKPIETTRSLYDTKTMERVCQ